MSWTLWPQPLFQNTLERPRVANLPGMYKIETMFIETTFKDSKKLKELQILYKNVIYLSVFLDIAKVADFRWRTQGLCHVIYIFFGFSLDKVL